jgi:glycerol-3-phosphate cytidylyltransferase/D-beta-D-heptose 7-phosphate kinase/D-beta-D-heptose 1-phosphate adenosyltransferase
VIPEDNVAVISGYFNPVHIGHLGLIRAAKELAPYLVAIVNNDRQQLIKKGRIIMPEEDRLQIVSELRSVDQVLLAVDDDTTVIKSLRLVRSMHPMARMVFCNGGDRSSVEDVPSQEGRVCAELEIEMRYGVGGVEKLDSSTRINGERDV